MEHDGRDRNSLTLSNDPMLEGHEEAQPAVVLPKQESLRGSERLTNIVISNHFCLLHLYCY